MKTFKLSERKAVADYVRTVSDKAYEVHLNSVVQIALDSISNDVVVTYAYFSEFADAEEFFNHLVDIKLSYCVYQIYLNDVFVNSDEGFDWVE